MLFLCAPKTGLISLSTDFSIGFLLNLEVFPLLESLLRVDLFLAPMREFLEGLMRDLLEFLLDSTLTSLLSSLTYSYLGFDGLNFMISLYY